MEGLTAQQSGAAPQEAVPKKSSQEVFDRARADLDKTIAEFNQHYHEAEKFLPPSEAEKFKRVLEIPELFEQKIRTLIKDPKYASQNLCSPEMQIYLNAYLTNYNAKQTGEVMMAMKEVLAENAIAQTDGLASPDVLSHQFFRRVIGDLVQKTAAMIMAEKTL
jgi:hypothetical protein